MLEKEFKYYKEHQDELVARYKGKFLIIQDERVIAVYDTEMEAYSEAKKKFESGTFLIQQCLPGKNSYTQTFHSRVAFK
ncbi:MAG: hypothetical protein KKF20_01215 [Bacteroidetes bacterium]|nr:hypothetical protein [Bacteroidota bacterium]MBU1421591.1 hypothetical protein [Bacteroidota bacterium]MBU2471013.1 hypothetical protein [Bacteroidota bacterium]MBU2636315.1 hypothetical protein [Bacteroidota bacterium]